MKTAVCKAIDAFNHQIPYPNAMTRKQMLHKVLDILIVAASGMGLAASLLLMLAMA